MYNDVVYFRLIITYLLVKFTHLLTNYYLLLSTSNLNIFIKYNYSCLTPIPCYIFRYFDYVIVRYNYYKYWHRQLVFQWTLH